MRFVAALMACCFLFYSSECHAQMGYTQDCYDCQIGLWDDLGLTVNSGTIEPHVPKDVFVGVKFAGNFQALQGMEFSIAGMRLEEDGILLLSVSEVIPVALRLGVFQAPADTSRTTSGRGGITLAWSTPVRGDNALVKLTLLVLEPVSNKRLQVKRRYPPSNPVYVTAIFTQPDRPFFTPVRVSVGCYVLNWDGSDNSCDVKTSVKQSTWSVLKGLYR